VSTRILFTSAAGLVLNTIVGAYDRGAVVTGDTDTGYALWWFVGVTTAPTKRDAQVGRSVRPGIVGRYHLGAGNCFCCGATGPERAQHAPTRRAGHVPRQQDLLGPLGARHDHHGARLKFMPAGIAYHTQPAARPVGVARGQLSPRSVTRLPTRPAVSERSVLIVEAPLSGGRSVSRRPQVNSSGQSSD
jgi:hypothetical protein